MFNPINGSDGKRVTFTLWLKTSLVTFDIIKNLKILGLTFQNLP